MARADAHYSIEPCHPLGFWSRKQEARVKNLSANSTSDVRQHLERNALSLIDSSMHKAAHTVAKLPNMSQEKAIVNFLLDDLFASPTLMEVLPCERVAEMLSDTWQRHAAYQNRHSRVNLPTDATVVSESSLIGGALALIGQDAVPTAGEETIACNYQGVNITVPKHARDYTGETVPSCPLLAATWQLWRLARLHHGVGQVRWWGREPTNADRTFTMLNTSLIPVEAAVAVILDSVDITCRNDIAYLFQPDHW